MIIVIMYNLIGDDLQNIAIVLLTNLRKYFHYNQLGTHKNNSSCPFHIQLIRMDGGGDGIRDHKSKIIS